MPNLCNQLMVTRKTNSQRGASVVEAMLLVALTIIVSFPAVTLFGNASSGKYEDLTLAFGGGTQTTSTEGEELPSHTAPISTLIPLE